MFLALLSPVVLFSHRATGVPPATLGLVVIGLLLLTLGWWMICRETER